jgi:hypothetical protein
VKKLDRSWLATALIMFLALGAIAGVLAGLLGVGGGLVLVAALAWLLPTLGIPRGRRCMRHWPVHWRASC